MRLRLVLCFAVLVGLNSCDKGLAPPPPKPYISGNVVFVGNWPVADSVKNLALVLVPGDPPYTVPGLISGVLNNSVKYSGLSYHNSDTTFRFDLDTGYYGYLGVAEQYGDSILNDWRVVGLAAKPDGTPRKFPLKLGDAYTDVIVRVKWDSLPDQPFTR